MASIAGIKLTGIKTWRGEEGYASQGNLYMDGTKIGFWSQDGYGGPDSFNFIQKQYVKMFFDRIKDYFRKNPPVNELELYHLKDSQLDINNLPRADVDKNDIGTDEECFMAELLELSNYEKEWKKAIKKGFKAIAIVSYYKTSEPTPLDQIWSLTSNYKKEAEEILDEAKLKKSTAYINVYAAASDFVLS